MTTKDEALKLALEALENLQGLCTDAEDGWVEAVTIWTPEAITAIREALAEQPAQRKPVAWKDKTYGNLHHQDFGNSIPLYTSPPANANAGKPWVGLTDDERGQIINANFGTGLWSMAKDVEAKLKEKNDF